MHDKTKQDIAISASKYLNESEREPDLCDL